MADKSKIEWTDASWTPIRARNKKTGKVGWHYVEIFIDEEMLTLPLRWKKPRMIFVCSMTDLFADFVPDEWIDEIFTIMERTPQHTFQVLTKRGKRMRDYLLKVESQEDRIMILPNVWLGVSAERQQEADERIPLLLQTPAAVRFISAEPLLGPIDLTCCGTHYKGSGPLHLWRAGGKKVWRKQFMAPPPEIDWVIAGGESGLNARPSHPDWYRSLRDQCATAGVSFFMKQWGNWKPIDQFPNGGIIRGASKHAVVDRDGRYVIDTDVADPPRTVFTFNMGKKSAGRLLDGVEYNEMPEVAR